MRTRHPAHLGSEPYVLQQITCVNKQIVHRNTRKRWANACYVLRVLITIFVSVSSKGQALATSPEVPVAADTGHQMVKIFTKGNFCKHFRNALLTLITPSRYFAFLNWWSRTVKGVAMIFIPRNSTWQFSFFICTFLKLTFWRCLQNRYLKAMQTSNCRIFLTLISFKWNKKNPFQLQENLFMQQICGVWGYFLPHRAHS